MKQILEKLGNVAEIIMGTSPKGNYYNQDGDGLPLINGPTEFGLSHPDVTLFTKISIRECRTGDLLFCVRGSTTGRMNWADKIYSIGRGICLIRGASCEDTKFIRYALEYDLPALLQLAGGATFPNLPRDTIASFKIPYPKQRQNIVSIISAYDDLIENNRQRIALLEESARELYKEWFVRLRFPGYELANIKNGVPEGWEKNRIKNLCESIDYGYTASAEQEEVGPKFLRITDIVPEVIEWSSVPYCKIDDAKKGKFLLHCGDIVIARTGATVGYAKRMNKHHPESVFASYLVRLKIKPYIGNHLLGIYMESDSYKDYIKVHVGGAAQPNANAQVLSSATILVPPVRIQEELRVIAEPIFDQKELLQIQNEKLKEARDILLPKLMNGEIEV